MYNYSKLFVVVIGLVTSGCTSMTGIVSENVDPVTGNSVAVYYDNDLKNVKAYSDRAAIIALLEDEEKVNLIYEKNYQPFWPNADFNTELMYTDKTITIDMSWQSQNAVFPLGEYEVIRAIHNRREGLAFLDLVSHGIRAFKKTLDDHGLKYKLVATFYGSADGAPVSKKLIYKGEYGTVAMDETQAHLNGTPHRFVIEPYQSISNEELACLRAYSLRTNLYRLLKQDYELVDKFDIEVHQKKGEQFRSAKITIFAERNS